MQNGQKQQQDTEQNLEKFAETQTTETSEERITTAHCILTAADTCGSLMWLQVEHAMGTLYCTWDHSHTYRANNNNKKKQQHTFP